jgi:hypothetical protein
MHQGLCSPRQGVRPEPREEALWATERAGSEGRLDQRKKKVDGSMIGPAGLARRLQDHAEPKDQAGQEG